MFFWLSAFISCVLYRHGSSTGSVIKWVTLCNVSTSDKHYGNCLKIKLKELHITNLCSVSSGPSLKWQSMNKTQWREETDKMQISCNKEKKIIAWVMATWLMKQIWVPTRQATSRKRCQGPCSHHRRNSYLLLLLWQSTGQKKPNRGGASLAYNFRGFTPLRWVGLQVRMN